MTISVEEMYASYSPEVRSYMKSVIDCLKKEYTHIPAAWRISLDLIADNYELYLKAKKEIDTNGLITEDKLHRERKNQCLTIMTTTQNKIIQLLNNFMLTPLSRNKMKNVNKNQIVDPLEELIA